MYVNELKRKWDAGEQAVNGWLAIASPFTAEIMAAQGYDALTIDMQHGAVDYQTAVAMMQAMTGRGPTILARVNWLDAGEVMRALDAGAMGIICPMVSTPAQAAEFASFMRYPPLGGRSSGPTRARFAYGGDYMNWANDQVLSMAQIETAEAMENLDAIAATPGLDALYVGPSDLTLSMSNGALPGGLDREEPEMIEAVKRIVEAAHKAGKKAVLHCGSPGYAKRGLDWGYDMVTLGADFVYLAAGAGAALAELKNA